jgi:DNA repair exonuclease SbcCD ATPase subunit
MTDNNLGWLREHLRDSAEHAAANDVREELDVPRMPASTGTKGGAAALDLVQRAAEVISGIERQASETEARAQSLVNDAIHKLELAEARIQATESARRVAISEAAAKLEQALSSLKQAEARIAVAEAQAAASEVRAKRAEGRANVAERALAAVENAIRTQLLGERPGAATTWSAAA